MRLVISDNRESMLKCTHVAVLESGRLLTVHGGHPTRREVEDSGLEGGGNYGGGYDGGGLHGGGLRRRQGWLFSVGGGC